VIRLRIMAGEGSPWRYQDGPRQGGLALSIRILVLMSLAVCSLSVDAEALTTKHANCYKINGLCSVNCDPGMVVVGGGCWNSPNSVGISASFPWSDFKDSFSRIRSFRGLSCFQGIVFQGFILKDSFFPSIRFQGLVHRSKKWRRGERQALAQPARSAGERNALLRRPAGGDRR
jgi:hypothetical protein